MWPWPQNIGYEQMQGWKIINPNRDLQVNFHIWPLTYLCDLWPQNITEANIGHLQTKFGYKQMQGWKVINRYRVLQVNFHIWPHLTYLCDLWPQNIMEANTAGPRKMQHNQEFQENEGVNEKVVCIDVYRILFPAKWHQDH